MKKERFFRLLGDLDDTILDKYRQMDAQLSRKAHQKKRTLRILAVAACLALLIGACVPVGMMVHPAGRAILRGDSQALTEQLNRIEGFKPWQEQTAEKLEQSVSPELWESLQKMPVINVLTQSQYPDYSFKSTQYGSYLAAPEYLTYGFADSIGDYFPDRVDIDVYGEEYQDFSAPSTCAPPPGSSLEEGQVLPYRYSIPQTLYTQAVHVYELRVDKVSYTVYLDAQTGECVYWGIIKASSHSSAAADEQTMVDAAYDILAEHVRDPEAYTLSTDRNDYYFICRYNRNIGDFESCDGVTVRFDLAGNILSVDLSYLGALRYLSEVPRELVDQINAYMEQTVVGCISSKIGIGNITVLSDGRIALTCYMEVEYNDAQSDMRQRDATWFLACLTEPIDGNGNEEITVTTTPVTTEPVTTEPETTEPVTTQPPRETESQIDFNDVPKFVKFGYLNIAVLDANGDVVYRVDAETLQSMKRSVEVEYVQGGTLILECYAAYNRSGKVRNYRCTAKDGVTEQIDLAEITTELEVDVQAEYVHYLRFSVPIDNMVTDSDRGYSMEMLGDYVYSSIEGRALMEYITVYLTELTDTTEPGSGFESEPESESESELNSEQIPFMVTSGFLSVDFQDEKGTVTSVIREEEIDHFYGTVELDELPNGQFIVECYAIFNPSGDVNFIAIPQGVTFEMLEPANVADRLSWSGETDGLYGFRMVIPTEVLASGSQGAMMMFEHPGYEVAQPVISVWFDIKDS